MLSDEGVLSTSAGRGGWLTPILLLIAGLALVVPALLVRYAPPVVPSARHRPVALPSTRVVPAAEVPPVEPVRYVALPMDEARAFNADVPFVTGPNPAARPFRFGGGDEDRARAVDCLAAALIYEAGDDAVGERAVAQVILNRLRHPAFPKTVCGVVFEGSQRRTGCQFTFTCDGAMTRWRPSPAGWTRAQAIAAAALNGAVHKPVGWATHYHTDWVVPYWQSSLDKIAKVGTHLFFRWTGWWGTPGAFRDPGGAGEPGMAALAAMSEVHRVAAGVSDGALVGLTLPEFEQAEAIPVAGDPDSFLVTLPPDTPSSLYPALAERACGARTRCKYSGWVDPRARPTTLPLQPEQIATMTFAYLRDRSTGVERTLWNCVQTPRPDKRDCMKVQVLTSSAPALPGSIPLPGVTPRGPAELDGVRRRERSSGLREDEKGGVLAPTPGRLLPAPTATPRATQAVQSGQSPATTP